MQQRLAPAAQQHVRILQSATSVKIHTAIMLLTYLAAKLLSLQVTYTLTNVAYVMLKVSTV